MKGQIITVALILLGHTFLTPAVQAIGFDYYNDHGVMSYGKGYGEDEKIIAQFPKMNRADLRLVTNISGERELVEGYIPTGNDSNLLIVFYVQIMPDDFVMQLHRF